MDDWQPIETAPRDGRYILGWIPGVGVMHWHGCNGDIVGMCWGAEKADNSGYWVCPHYFKPEPTHWMPGPPPPKGTP